MTAQLIFNAIATGAVYALAAQGFCLAYHGSRVLHIGHAGTIAAAGFGALACAGFGAVWVAVAAGLLAGGIVGVAQELAIYAPLRRRGAASGVMIIASLGITIVVVQGLALAFGAQNQILSSGLAWVASVGPVRATATQLGGLAAAVIGAGLVFFLVRRSGIGRDAVALIDSPELAEVLGMPVGRLRVVLIGAGSLFAGGAAVLVALDSGVDPRLGFDLLLVSIAGAIIGGRRSLWGGLVGGSVVGVVESLVASIGSPAWASTGTFAVLVLALLIRPDGLLGVKRRASEATA